MFFKAAKFGAGMVLNIGLIFATNACSQTNGGLPAFPQRTSSEERRIDEKQQVAEFMKRVKLAADADIIRFPDKFQEATGVTTQQSRLPDGTYSPFTVKLFDTGLTVLNDLMKPQKFDTKSNSFHYAVGNRLDPSDVGAYSFQFGIPELMCFSQKETEELFGEFRLYIQDRRYEIMSNMVPSARTPGGAWDLVGVIDRKGNQLERWYFSFSYEDGNSPLPKCLEQVTVGVGKTTVEKRFPNHKPSK